jgi:hypothetical protein
MKTILGYSFVYEPPDSNKLIEECYVIFKFAPNLFSLRKMTDVNSNMLLFDCQAENLVCSKLNPLIQSPEMNYLFVSFFGSNLQMIKSHILEVVG